MILNSQELLEWLLTGNQLTADNLDNLLSNKVQEDLHLDYKHGNLLRDKKQASKIVRQYISGFANSSGGILIVGIDEADWRVTGCTAPGGGNLEEWASRCLTPIAHSFSPLPGFQTVNHPNGNVLIIYVDRSLGIIPCLESGKIVYYLRLHDQTLEAPEYLVSDLLLGKRQHANLHLRGFRLVDCVQHGTGNAHIDLQFMPCFEIANEGLLWAENVRLGLIAFCKQPNKSQPNSRYLLAHLQINDLEDKRFEDQYHLSHIDAKWDVIEPFTNQQGIVKQNIILPIRVSFHWLNYTWQAGMYILSKDSPPTWYQLTFELNDEITHILSTENFEKINSFLKFERLSAKRPVVSWAQLKIHN